MELAHSYPNKFNYKRILPYLVIFIISLVGVLVSFYNGYPAGDDTYFHISNIYDIYLSLKSGNISPISANLASGLGVGKQLFYAPLAHYIPAVLGIILEPLGFSLLDAFKLTLFLSVFISAIFMYRFSMHISKGKILISLVMASLYTLYPYRYFDAFCRLAYAEALSFWFLPLFFMGIYDICHMKELNSKPFIETIIGGALLFLTHNLTAFYAFAFAILYLLVYIVNIFRMIKKNKLFIAYIAISLFIMIGLMSVTLFQSFTLLNNDYYNISDPVKMWSNVDAVILRNLDAGNYSGFLNFIFLNGLGIEESSSTALLFDVLFFTLASTIFVVINNLLKRFKYIHLLAGLIVYAVLIYFLTKRLEVYIAAIAFIAIYSFVDILNETNLTKKKLYKSINFWYSLFMIVLVIYMIARHDIWYILPKIFLNIQFPWRLWAFIPLYLCILLSEVSNSISSQKLYSSVLIIVSTLFVVLNMSYIEKRIAYERNYNNNNPNGWTYEISDQYFTKISSIGACVEYLPKIYYYNSDYVPENPNSLYRSVYNEIMFNIGKYPNRINPVFLEGSGEIEITYRKTPKFEMYITTNEKSTIQMPLFYYDGYEITIKDSSNATIVKAKDIDSLISFDLDKGEYVVSIDYVGTKTRQVSIMYRTIAIYSIFIFVPADMLYLAYNDRKKRRMM